MAYLLNLVYLAAILVASPWLLYPASAARQILATAGGEVLGAVPRRTGDARCLWLHAVSVGEVNLLEPIVEAVAAAASGLGLRHLDDDQDRLRAGPKKYAPRLVFYCPLDFTWAVRRAMRRIRPDLLVLAELELWPNLIAAANGAGARSPSSTAGWAKKASAATEHPAALVQRRSATLDLIAVQNEEYAERFLALGAPPIVRSLHRLASNSTAHAPIAVTRKRSIWRHLAGIGHDDMVFLAGSTQEPEEQLALSVFQRARARISAACV